MNTREIDRFDIVLMNQVNELVRIYLAWRVRSPNSDTHYPVGNNHNRVKIELEYSSTKDEYSRLVVSYRSNPNNNWISTKFNYSASSIKRLLEQLEYINIALHRDNTK